MATREAIWSRLSLVIEPELGLPITDLGLIYDVILDDTGRKATIRMTLTSPLCPLAPEILRMVEEAARGVDGLEAVHVDVVFDPPWDPRTMATDEALDALGLD